MRVILASKSPARKKLFSEIFSNFEVIASGADEDQVADLNPAKRVQKLARWKAETVLQKINEKDNEVSGKNEVLIVSADTMVFLPPKTFIGKPHDLTEAKRILSTLSGSTHYIYTGICVVKKTVHNGQINVSKKTAFDKTKMKFRKLSEIEIEDYIKRINVLILAGSYSIETNTPGASFIEKIEGSYTNVLGLPMEKLRSLLLAV